MNIGTWLTGTAARCPEWPALFFGERPVLTYRDFAAQSLALAGWLTAASFKPGDRVAIFMENVPNYLVVQYGIWLAGMVCVPINAKLHGREAAWILKNAGADLVFATAKLRANLKQADVAARVLDVESSEFDECVLHEPARPISRAPSDLAWLFYTSGTTGQPKGVMITHRMLAAMALAYVRDVDDVSAQDAALYAAPMSHGAGIYNLMHVQKGARHVFPPSRGFDPIEIFQLSRQLGSVHMFAAPTMVKRLTDVARQVGETGEGLRTIVYAGGPMYVADIMDATETFGDIFVQIYGQGECPMAITVLPRADVSGRSHPNWRERLASVGFAQSCGEVEIVDDTGANVPHGTPGEIVVRGDAVMPGYWENPEATASTLKDGWLWTGDVGFMDASGYVTMVDRSKDMIISGGSNIYPREVEEALLTHPAVHEVSVVGRPHPDWGEEVVAFVVADSAVTDAELDAHCLDQIARFKRPKSYVAIETLPKNNYGKVLKTELRAKLIDRT